MPYNSPPEMTTSCDVSLTPKHAATHAAVTAGTMTSGAATGTKWSKHSKVSHALDAGSLLLTPQTCCSTSRETQQAAVLTWLLHAAGNGMVCIVGHAYVCLTAAFWGLLCTAC